MPLPSCPKALPPQHQTVPSARSAHEDCPPTVSAVASSIVLTVTGAVAQSTTVLPRRQDALCVGEPSPSCPLSFVPQHWMLPLVRRAQVCEPLPWTSTTPVSPVTSTGLWRSVVVPSPS